MRVSELDIRQLEETWFLGGFGNLEHGPLASFGDLEIGEQLWLSLRQPGFKGLRTLFLAGLPNLQATLWKHIEFRRILFFNVYHYSGWPQLNYGGLIATNTT